MAHRVVWEAVFGPIPDGMHVCHECDNPPCVNPAHLFLGTNLENRLDSVRKGRQAKGSGNGVAKLTEETAVYAMARLLAGESQTAVASAFGVTQGAMGQLWRGKTWRHVFGS